MTFDRPALTRWNYANRRSRRAYYSKQEARPNNPRACIDCGAPTKTRSGYCARCEQETL
jgi:hypothetical protein